MGGNRKYSIWDKHEIQKKLHTYLSRREKNKKKGLNVAYLRKKIGLFRSQLVKLDKKEAEVVEFASKVEDFVGVRLWKNNSNFPSKEVKLGRSLLCKMGIERGIKGANIAWYLNYSSLEVAYDRRRKFQKSLQWNKKLQKKYQEFKQHLKYDEENNR